MAHRLDGGFLQQQRANVTVMRHQLLRLQVHKGPTETHRPTETHDVALQQT
jgi:hypothetical protein